MSRQPALGAATVVLVERIRRKHGEFIDGATETFTGCSVQGAGSTESDGGLTTEATWNLWVPGGDFPVDTKNMVRWNGLELMVDGKMQVEFDDLSGVALFCHGRLKAWEA